MMPKLAKGNLVYWKIDSSTVIKREALENELEKFGKLSKKSKKTGSGSHTASTFVDLLPRNDFKAAMIRALRNLCRDSDNDEFYKRFQKFKGDKKTNEEVFLILLPELFDNDLDVKKLIQIDLNKTTGEVEITLRDSGGEFANSALIRDEFKRMQKMVDAAQLSTVMRRIVDEECDGIPINSGSGVYYIPEAKKDQLDILKKFANLIPNQKCRLSVITLSPTAETITAVADAVEEELLKKLEDLKTEIIDLSNKKGELSETILANRKVEVEELASKLELYRHDLEGRSDTIKKRLDSMTKVLNKATSPSSKTNLADALKRI